VKGAKAPAAAKNTDGTTAKAAKPPKEPKAPKAPGESAGAGAPRPRKHEYGIKDDASVVVKPEGAEAAKRAGVAKAYEHAQPKDQTVVDGKPTGGTPVTVKEFYERGGDRHDLRVMSRRGLISIVWPTGETFPQAAAPKPLEQPKPSDAAPAPAAAEAAPAAAEPTKS
jgi:hypothetical protein